MQDSTETGGYQAGLVKRTGRFGDDKDPNMGAGSQWAKGQSGNPRGRPKGKSLSTVIQDMLQDELFIDKLNTNVKEAAGLADPDFQSTPMTAMITTAIVEAINPNGNPRSRAIARDWLAKFGYGTKVDLVSNGETLSSPLAGLSLEELQALVRDS